MSLRKRQSPKRRAAGKAAKALAVMKLASPASAAVTAFARERAGKRLGRRDSRRKPLAVAAGVLGVAGAVALAKRGKPAQSTEQGYGPPNESVPSHETLAPAKA